MLSDSMINPVYVSVSDYPYFPKKLEEDCFHKSNGVPRAYARAMAELLFPDTLHLFFKDQDLEKRNWLRAMVDRRFPTLEGLHRSQNWKYCLAAINKNRIRTAESKISSPILFVGKQSSEKQNVEKKHDKKTKKMEEAALQRRASSKSRSDQTVAVARKTEKAIAKESSRKGRESARLNAPLQTEKTKAYTSYPFVSEKDEIECFESSKKDLKVYARSLGRLLFKDNMKTLYKGQDKDRKQWLNEILNFRFPSGTVEETRSKMGNAIAAINKNALKR